MFQNTSLIILHQVTKKKKGLTKEFPLFIRIDHAIPQLTRSVQGDDLILEDIDQRLRTIVDLQLVEDARQMVLDRLL
jgi:hypothetical protein